MNRQIEILTLDKISLDEFSEFIIQVNNDFIPPLLDRIDIELFFNKIKCYSNSFICRVDNRIAGLLILYANNFEEKKAYISLLATKSEYRCMGIATKLLSTSFDYARIRGMLNIGVHTFKDSLVEYYMKRGFSVVSQEYSNERKVDRYYLEKKLKQ